MSAYSLDVNDADFQLQVIEASRTVPVVIDFWAEWCGPCRTLKPLLEKLAAEYGGRFILAKIDSDKNPALAQRYAVRGIPTVIAIINGEEADRFSGAQPEATLRSFLDKLMPSPADELYQTARAALAANDATGALRTLEEALQLDSKHLESRLLAAEIMFEASRWQEARETLNQLTDEQRSDNRVGALLARLEFAAQSADLPSADALEARIHANEGDLDARLQLAKLLIAQENFEPALAQLLEIIRRDRSFGDDVGRKTMLSVFNLLGGSGDLVSSYRRKLASLLNI